MQRPPQKILFLVAFASVVTFIALFAVFGENGFIDVYSFRQERNKIAAQKSALEDENRKLAVEINLLKNDRRYISNVARRELGMIGKNEIVYKIEN